MLHSPATAHARSVYLNVYVRSLRNVRARRKYVITVFAFSRLGKNNDRVNEYSCVRRYLIPALIKVAKIIVRQPVHRKQNPPVGGPVPPNLRACSRKHRFELPALSMIHQRPLDSGVNVTHMRV